MTKILLISNMYPSNENPGCGIFIKSVIDSLFEVDPSFQFSYSVIRGRNKGMIHKIWRYTIFYCSIIYHLTFFNYDVVYVHYITHAALPLRFMSIWKNLPLIFNVHGRDLLTKSRLAAYFLRIVLPLLCKSKLIILPSYFFLNKFKMIFPQIEPHKLFVSPSGGINNSIFHPLSLPRQFIGYVSRVEKMKGIDIFLEALNILHNENIDFKAIIIGKNVEKGFVTNQLNKFKINNNVLLIEELPHHDLALQYNKMEVMIFPTKFEESLGLVGLEAMACGTPVIGSRCGALPDYITDKSNGLLFNPEDAQDLATKIKYFLNLTGNEKNFFQRNAINTAKHFSRKKVIQELHHKFLTLT